MKLERLRIQNFRSLQDLEIELPQVCALVGPNNSGKSNLLLALQRVLGRDWVTVSNFNEDDVYGRDADRDVTIKLSFDPPVSYTKFKESPPVAVKALSFTYTRYKVGPRKGERRLEQKCFAPNGRPPMVMAKAPKKDSPPAFEPLVNIPPGLRESVPLIYIGTNRSLKEQLPNARYSLLRQLIEDLATDFSDPGNVVTVKKADGSKVQVPRSDRFSQLMARALAVLRTDEFERLEEAIKRNALRQLGFDPDTDADKLDLYFSPFDAVSFYKSLELRVIEGDFEINATQLGEGFQNAIVLAILQAFEERRKRGAILLIEEPEMFLHPQMQRSLYRTLRGIGKTNQVIYTTHSPHFVAVPEYRDVLLVRRDEDGTSVTASDLPTSAARTEKLRKELDPERNELFFASRLLLVEGDTEKLALPVYADRLGLDLDREGATIVEVGGKRNLEAFADIAGSFGIPTGIVYDEDSSDLKGKPKEEAALNRKLDGYAKRGDMRVWRLRKKYEDHLREALGEKVYQELCQKHSGVSKAIRAKLIAQEDEPIPDPVEEILRWLACKEEETVPE